MTARTKWRYAECPKGILEIFLVCLVAAVSFSLNYAYLSSIPEPLENRYQAQLSHLYPAIFWAAGQGLGTTDVNTIPGLPEFIYGEAESFDLATIPHDLELVPITSPVRSHLYFVYTVGLFWRFFGVSQDALILLLVVLRTISAVLVYGIFRIGLGRAMAFLSTVIVASSPVLLYEGMLIRDFARAPFLFAFFLLVLHLVTRRHSWRYCLTLSAVLGLVLGIGMGFRSDLIICVPPVVITLLLFTRIRGQKTLRNRLACLAVFLVTFFPLSYPILFGEGITSDQSPLHAVLLGLSPDMESALEFGGASYQVMPEARIGDSATLGVVTVHARRTGVTASLVNKNSAEYQRYTGDKNTHLLLDPYLVYNGNVYAENAETLVRELFLTFPADFFSRAWTAVATVPAIPERMHRQLSQSINGLPPWLHATLSLQGALARHLAKWGLLYTLVVLCALSISRLTIALYFAAMLAWFGGYPSILYEYRHTFYLGIVPLFMLTLCLNGLLRTAKALYAKESRRSFLRNASTRSYWKVPVFAFIVSAIIILPVWVLRIWQTEQVTRLADTIDVCPKTPLALSGKAGEDEVLLRPQENLSRLPEASSMGPGEISWEYLALSFDTHGYDIPVTIHYDRSRLFNDYTQTITIRGVQDGGLGKVRFYFPVYETDITFSMDLWRDFQRVYPFLAGSAGDTRPLEEQDWWKRGKFEGVSFPTAYLGLFERAFLINDASEATILPLIQIPENRAYLKTYKTGPLERAVYSVFSEYRGEPQQEDPPKPCADFWTLDESLLFHDLSPIFDAPLLAEDTLSDYRKQWRKRVALLPLLSEAAALDLANKGTEWAREERPEEAIGAYTASCKFAPTNPLYSVRLGQLLQRLGEKEKALDAYKRALLLQPTLPDTARQMEALSAETGETAGLRDFWLRVSKAHPDSWFAGTQTGMILERRKEYAKAVDVYQRILTAHPEHPDTSLALARCLLEVGRYPEAYALIERIAAHTPSHKVLAAQILGAMASALSVRGEYAEAEAACLQALNLTPDDSSLWQQLGEAQYHNGKIEESRRSKATAAAYASEKNGAHSGKKADAASVTSETDAF